MFAPAISTVPQWIKQPDLPDAGYTLPIGYAMFNGTSMASPQAAGAAALLLSAGFANDKGFTPAQMAFELSAELRYAGQSSELAVTIDEGRTPADFAEAFGASHQAMFGYRTAEPVEVAAVRCLARGLRTGRYEFVPQPRRAGRPQPIARRAASFAPGEGFIETPIFAWDAVGAEAIPGPAIIEAYDTTVVVPPGAAIHADDHASLVIETR